MLSAFISNGFMIVDVYGCKLFRRLPIMLRQCNMIFGGVAPKPVWPTLFCEWRRYWEGHWKTKQHWTPL